MPAKNGNLHNAIYRADPGTMADIRKLAYLESAASGRLVTVVEMVNRALAAYVEAHKVILTGGGK